jgi:Domain of unknown function (DUF4347)/FG-GAP-like repeat
MTSNSILAAQDFFTTRVSASTLVVFDSRVSEIETLSQALLPGAVSLTIDTHDDGLETITKMLAQTGAKYLAIVAHGEPGVVHLGKNSIDIEQLQAQSQLLSAWGVKEIALYSCEVAQGEIGKSLIYQLSELTGATVAAAATKTGSAALGGSWNLAVTTGKITAPRLFESKLLQIYQFALGLDFAPQVKIFEAGEYFVAAADLNKDGKIDLVTKGLADNTISVLTGDGSGSFNAGGILSNIGFDPFDASLADFNGDGNLDLLLEDGSDPSIALGNGSGGFDIATVFELPTGIFGLPNGSYVGDVNGDGKPDIISAINLRSQPSQISVLLNNGSGGFGVPVVTTVGINADDIAVGDVNGDGKLDLVTTNGILGSRDNNPDFSLVNNISVLLGNGNGGFSAPTNINVGNETERVVVGDFNGDTKLDIVVSTSAPTDAGGTTYSISALLNNGTGTFGSPTNSTAAGSDAIEVADLNGDGKLDLVIAQGSSDPGEIAVLTGNGLGGFSAPTILNVGRYPNSIAIGDFNSDSKPDLAVADFGDSNISVLLNRSTPPYTRNDFNGDGKSDILWRNDFGSVAVWQMNGATVTSGNLTSVPNIDASWKAAGTGDFNGDGKSDILWRNTNGAVAVWTMDGATVTASNRTSTPTLDNSWKTAGTGDYNGDGKSDILWRNDNGSIAVWTMNGATITSSVLTSTPALDNSWKVAGNSDFNGDGKADILWRNDDGSVALWQMNGAAITASTAVAKLSTDWKVAGTGDFSGDGKADILWRNDDGRVVLWQMNGAAITSSNLTSTPSLDSSQTIAGIGDYNGDSKADILWRKDTGALEVWQMSGSTVVSSTLTSVAPDGGYWKIAAPII